MKILDEELEFSFLDADDVERLENAVENTRKELNKIDDKENYSKLIRKTCEIINKCFDDIFGDKTSERIFKGKHNISLCLKAFKQLIEEREKQEKELNNDFEKFSNYLPNRQTRRKK